MSALLKIWIAFLILGSILIILHSKQDTSIDYQKFSTSKEKILQAELVDFIKKEKLNQHINNSPINLSKEVNPAFQYLP